MLQTYSLLANYKIEELSYELGYKDVAHFSKYFKKELQYTTKGKMYMKKGNPNIL